MNTIKVETVVQSSVEKVWDMFTKSEHIEKWNYASDDWECPYVENDVKADGKFLFRMAAKDGSFSFDFKGTYIEIVPRSKISYTIEDGRNVEVLFEEMEDGQTKVTEIFEPENENTLDLQKSGWQSILTNFKKYVESQ